MSILELCYKTNNNVKKNYMKYMIYLQISTIYFLLKS